MSSTIKPSARKELEDLSDQLIARLVQKIEGLAANPRPLGCRKLRGYKDLWRVRVGITASSTSSTTITAQ